MVFVETSTYSPYQVNRAFPERRTPHNLNLVNIRRTQEEDKSKGPYPVGDIHPLDGVRWNGRSFDLVHQVDEDDVNDPEYDEEQRQYIYERENSKTPECRPQGEQESRYSVSLWDIAKPAKPRGSKKEYEMVRGVKQVIALDDDSMSSVFDDESFTVDTDFDLSESWDEGDWDEDDWESSSEVGDALSVKKKLYSNVVKNCGGTVGDG